jgi:hypothetical protein
LKKHEKLQSFISLVPVVVDVVGAVVVDAVVAVAATPLRI